MAVVCKFFPHFQNLHIVFEENQQKQFLFMHPTWGATQHVLRLHLPHRFQSTHPRGVRRHHGKHDKARRDEVPGASIEGISDAAQHPHRIDKERKEINDFFQVFFHNRNVLIVSLFHRMEIMVYQLRYGVVQRIHIIQLLILPMHS